MIFLYPPQFSWFHVICNPHLYHNLIVNMLTVQSGCSQCSEKTLHLPPLWWKWCGALMIKCCTWFTTKKINYYVFGKICHLCWKMNALAQDLMTELDLTNFWKNYFFTMPKNSWSRIKSGVGMDKKQLISQIIP